MLLIALAVPASAATLEGKVIKIVDADTIDVLDADKTTHRVRLHGIDAPEAGAPFSKKAKQALADLVHEKQVVVELNEDKDRYGRFVGRVSVGGTDVCLAMLDGGWAWHFTKYDDSQEFAAAEAAAKKAGRGLWADPKPIPPYEWRATAQGRISHRRAARTFEQFGTACLVVDEANRPVLVGNAEQFAKACPNCGAAEYSPMRQSSRKARNALGRPPDRACHTFLL